MMRRLSIMFVLVAVLAGCSSGSGNVASSTQPTTPRATDSTSPTATPTVTNSTKTTKVSVGADTSFCAPAKRMQSVTSASDWAVFRALAAELRQYAPNAIKVEVVSYANFIDDTAKAFQPGTVPTYSENASTEGIPKIVDWVKKNCPK